MFIWLRAAHVNPAIIPSSRCPAVMFTASLRPSEKALDVNDTASTTTSIGAISIGAPAGIHTVK
jgi:hypothetical protein